MSSANPQSPVTDPDVAIRVENLTKTYKLYNSPLDRLKEAVNPFAKKYHHDFHALKDISFEIKKGESVGIIGRNGSGKSTLLKILTGVLTPTSGSVKVNGKVSALLELGAGFNPELTGIENVYFNGMLMGYKRDEMDTRLEDILSFADIGEFVYQPVKAYSSGMFVRLAFALAVNVEPDILVIDEALSVGDVFFQQKCFDRMRKIIDSNITLLFVSHDMTTMQSVCRRGILLSKGKLIADSDSIVCASAYYLPVSDNNETQNVTTLKYKSPKFMQTYQYDNEKKMLIDNNIFTKKNYEQGDKKLEIIAVNIVNDNIDKYKMLFNDKMMIKLLLKANGDIATPNVGISIFDSKNTLIFCTSAYQVNHIIPAIKEGNEIIISFKIMLPLHLGEYTFSIGCSEVIENDYTKSITHHRIFGLGPILLETLSDKPLTFDGIVELPIEFI